MNTTRNYHMNYGNSDKIGHACMYTQVNNNLKLQDIYTTLHNPKEAVLF